MTRAPARKAAADTETAPEADRLEGFPHPRETPALFGHADAETQLRQAFDGARLHHAWLITGAEGIGKATLAYRLARYALAKPHERALAPPGQLAVPQDQLSCRQILSQAHPGLLVIRRVADGKRLSSVIRVEEVRRLKQFLGLTADHDSWRVVIVDAADELNQNAANALLKSLEEPPSRCLFLLLSCEPGRLLPTIRSRCRTLELQPLREADLWHAVDAALGPASVKPPAADERAQLTALAHGSVRRALMLWGSGGLALNTKLMALMDSLPDLDMTLLHAIAEELSPAAAVEKFETFYALLFDLIPRLVRAATLARFDGTDEDRLAGRLMPRDRLASWAELWETILRDKAITTALNLDKKSLVLQTGFKMRAVCQSR